MVYNWELQDWPDFQYSLLDIEPLLYAFTFEAGEVSGTLKSLPQDIQQESMLEVMISEAIKTSEIEGEFLSRHDVMSSIRNNLGINKIPEHVKDQKSQGAGQLMVDIRNSYQDNLTCEKLWEWHKMLLSSSLKIRAGQWRTGNEPMQIISGSIGKEKIHFQAPPSEQVPDEMDRFILWFNETAPDGKNAMNSAPVRAAIAHLYFESIHPFEDGNGRIGRAIAEKTLSQTLGRPVVMSLSRTVEADKKSYYTALQQAQTSNEITGWVRYFVEVVLKSQRDSRQQIEFTLQKIRFFDLYGSQLNDRQAKVIHRMLESGISGFEGGMSAKKYMSICKTSKATATRDLQTLHEMGIMKAQGRGRSVRYNLCLEY